MTRETIGAILLAAGRSERMGGFDKLLATLGGRPLIAHPAAALAACTAIDHLVVVTSAQNRDAVVAAVGPLAPHAIFVTGGARRRDSVAAGLLALDGCALIVVHDGARPLVTPAMIEAAIAGAREDGAAICALPVTDTVKRADHAGRIAGTVSRRDLWLAQTPQAFRFDILSDAHRASDIDATDDAALVEHLGLPVRLVQGAASNLKVTTLEDLALAEALIALQERA